MLQETTDGAAFDVEWIDTLGVPASVHDLEGRFLRLNTAAERAGGMTNEEMIGRHYTDPIPESARPEIRAHFRRTAELGEPVDFETAFVDGDGNERRVRALYLPLVTGDQTVAVLILGFEARKSARSIVPESPPHLTTRKQEILELLAAGHSTAEIAAELWLAPVTVRNHVGAIFRALEVHTRPEAIAAAQRHGLLPPEPLAPTRSSDGRAGRSRA